MPHNPSELARLEDELQYYRAVAISTSHSKQAREGALVKLRKIEKQLGIESQPYNSDRF